MKMKKLTSAVLATLLLALIPAFAQEKAESPKQVQRLNRAPVNKDVLQVKLPRPTETKLPNGLTVLVLEQHKLPTVSFVLWVKAGALNDPKEKPGLAEFTAALIREGTKKRDSAQIAAETDQMGATLSTGAAYGSALSSVSISGLVESADRMLDLMSDVVLNPSFPQAELDKYKARKLPQLEEQRSEPGFLAQEKFYQVLYGDFPAAVISATPASVNAATVADLQRFHEQYYAPNNAILGIVGDVSQQQALALAKKYFGAWKQRPVPKLDLPPVPAQHKRQAYLIDRPGSVQSNVVLGNLSLKRTDPDYIPMVVVDRILGSGASSRLFLNLREEKGYTYGSYSDFSADIYPGPFLATSEQRNSVTGPAIQELVHEFRRMREEPVPAAELDEAKRSIVAVFALSLENPNNLLNRALTVKYYGLPPDYWDRYPVEVAKVDAPTVAKTSQKYIALDNLQFVVVGDSTQPGTEDKDKPKTIKEAVGGFAPVQMFDADGKPLTEKK